jgi:hypothetical protein
MVDELPMKDVPTAARITLRITPFRGLFVNAVVRETASVKMSRSFSSPREQG